MDRLTASRSNAELAQNSLELSIKGLVKDTLSVRQARHTEQKRGKSAGVQRSIPLNIRREVDKRRISVGSAKARLAAPGPKPVDPLLKIGGMTDETDDDGDDDVALFEDNEPLSRPASAIIGDRGQRDCNATATVTTGMMEDDQPPQTIDMFLTKRGKTTANDFLTERDKSALKVGRLVMSSIFEQPEEAPTTSDAISRFFFDAWLSKNGSSLKKADTLSIELMSTLQKSKAETEMYREQRESTQYEPFLGLEEQGAGAGTEETIHSKDFSAGLAFGALDYVVQEFGEANPVLREIRDILAPCIFIDPPSFEESMALCGRDISNNNSSRRDSGAGVGGGPGAVLHTYDEVDDDISLCSAAVQNTVVGKPGRIRSLGQQYSNKKTWYGDISSVHEHANSADHALDEIRSVVQRMEVEIGATASRHRKEVLILENKIEDILEGNKESVRKFEESATVVAQKEKEVQSAQYALANQTKALVDAQTRERGLQAKLNSLNDQMELQLGNLKNEVNELQCKLTTAAAIKEEDDELIKELVIKKREADDIFKAQAKTKAEYDEKLKQRRAKDGHSVSRLGEKAKTYHEYIECTEGFLNDQYARNNMRLQAQAKELETLRATIRSMTTAHEELQQAKLASEEALQHEMMINIQLKDDEIAAIEDKVRHAESEIVKYSSKYGEEKDKAECARLIFASKEAQWREEKEQSDIMHEHSRVEIASLKQKSLDIIELTQTQKEKIFALETSCEEHMCSLNACHEKISSLEKQVAQLSTEVEQAEHVRQLNEKEIGRLTRELEKTTAEIERHRQGNTLFEDQVKELTEQKDRLVVQAIAATEKLKSVEEALAMQKQQTDGWISSRDAAVNDLKEGKYALYCADEARESLHDSVFTPYAKHFKSLDEHLAGVKAAAADQKEREAVDSASAAAGVGVDTDTADAFEEVQDALRLQRQEARIVRRAARRAATAAAGDGQDTADSDHDEEEEEEEEERAALAARQKNRQQKTLGINNIVPSAEMGTQTEGWEGIGVLIDGFHGIDFSHIGTDTEGYNLDDLSSCNSVEGEGDVGELSQDIDVQSETVGLVDTGTETGTETLIHADTGASFGAVNNIHAVDAGVGTGVSTADAADVSGGLPSGTLTPLVLSAPSPKGAVPRIGMNLPAISSGHDGGEDGSSPSPALAVGDDDNQESSKKMDTAAAGGNEYQHQHQQQHQQQQRSQEDSQSQMHPRVLTITEKRGSDLVLPDETDPLVDEKLAKIEKKIARAFKKGAGLKEKRSIEKEFKNVLLLLAREKLKFLEIQRKYDVYRDQVVVEKMTNAKLQQQVGNMTIDNVNMKRALSTTGTGLLGAGAGAGGSGSVGVSVSVGVGSPVRKGSMYSIATPPPPSTSIYGNAYSDEEEGEGEYYYEEEGEEGEYNDTTAAHPDATEAGAVGAGGQKFKASSASKDGTVRKKGTIPRRGHTGGARVIKRPIKKAVADKNLTYLGEDGQWHEARNMGDRNHHHHQWREGELSHRKHDYLRAHTHEQELEERARRVVSVACGDNLPIPGLSVDQGMMTENDCVKGLANEKRPPKDVAPFVNFIRQHEKRYALEVGKLSIMLREGAALITRVIQVLESIVPASFPSSMAPVLDIDKVQTIIMNIIADIEDNEWIFDTNLSAAEVTAVFGSDVDPVYVSAQMRMFTTYNLDLVKSHQFLGAPVEVDMASIRRRQQQQMSMIAMRRNTNTGASLRLSHSMSGAHTDSGGGGGGGGGSKTNSISIPTVAEDPTEIDVARLGPPQRADSTAFLRSTSPHAASAASVAQIADNVARSFSNSSAVSALSEPVAEDDGSSNSSNPGCGAGGVGSGSSLPMLEVPPSPTGSGAGSAAGSPVGVNGAVGAAGGGGSPERGRASPMDDTTPLPKHLQAHTPTNPTTTTTITSINGGSSPERAQQQLQQQSQQQSTDGSPVSKRRSLAVLSTTNRELSRSHSMSIYGGSPLGLGSKSVAVLTRDGNSNQRFGVNSSNSPMSPSSGKRFAAGSLALGSPDTPGTPSNRKSQQSPKRQQHQQPQQQQFPLSPQQQQQPPTAIMMRDGGPEDDEHQRESVVSIIEALREHFRFHKAVSGDWKSLLYREDGTVDTNISLIGYEADETVAILQEMVSGLKKERAKSHAMMHAHIKKITGVLSTQNTQMAELRRTIQLYKTGQLRPDVDLAERMKKLNQEMSTYAADGVSLPYYLELESAVQKTIHILTSLCSFNVGTVAEGVIGDPMTKPVTELMSIEINNTANNKSSTEALRNEVLMHRVGGGVSGSNSITGGGDSVSEMPPGLGLGMEDGLGIDSLLTASLVDSASSLEADMNRKPKQQMHGSIYHEPSLSSTGTRGRVFRKLVSRRLIEGYLEHRKQASEDDEVPGFLVSNSLSQRNRRGWKKEDVIPALTQDDYKLLQNRHKATTTNLLELCDKIASKILCVDPNTTAKIMRKLAPSGTAMRTNALRKRTAGPIAEEELRVGMDDDESLSTQRHGGGEHSITGSRQLHHHQQQQQPREEDSFINFDAGMDTSQITDDFEVSAAGGGGNGTSFVAETALAYNSEINEHVQEILLLQKKLKKLNVLEDTSADTVINRAKNCYRMPSRSLRELFPKPAVEDKEIYADVKHKSLGEFMGNGDQGLIHLEGYEDPFDKPKIELKAPPMLSKVGHQEAIATAHQVAANTNFIEGVGGNAVHSGRIDNDDGLSTFRKRLDKLPLALAKAATEKKLASGPVNTITTAAGTALPFPVMDTFNHSDTKGFSHLTRTSSKSAINGGKRKGKLL